MGSYYKHCLHNNVPQNFDLEKNFHRLHHDQLHYGHGTMMKKKLLKEKKTNFWEPMMMMTTIKNDCSCSRQWPSSSSSSFSPPSSFALEKQQSLSKWSTDMLNWINGCLRSNFTQIETLKNGSAYCQLMDLLFPGTLSLKKVKFHSESEEDFVENFKILQTAFQKASVDKIIPIEKLVKGGFQSNFEFLEWFQTFFVTNTYYRGHSFNYNHGFSGYFTSSAPHVCPPKSFRGHENLFENQNDSSWIQQRDEKVESVSETKGKNGGPELSATPGKKEAPLRVCVICNPPSKTVTTADK